MMQDPAQKNAQPERQKAALSAALVNAAPAAAVPLLRKLAAAQAAHGLFPAPAEERAAPRPVIVALSGGPDSVALLHALYQFAPIWNLALHVTHLDHALRPTSAQDAAFCAELAHKFNLPFDQERLEPGALTGDPAGIEAAARRVRYAFLARVAAKIDTSPSTAPSEAAPVTVATGHHMADQAETVLMHLATGAGLAGLAGMAWITTVQPDAAQPPLRLVRPLLAVEQAQIRAYLAAYQLTWCEDETNRDTHYLRNRLRHQVLPVLAEINPSIHATLARTGELVAADLARLQQLDAAALQNVMLEPSAQKESAATQPDRVVLDLERLRALDAATQRGVLRLALQRLGANLRELGAVAIDTLRRRTAEIDHATAPAPLNAELQWTILGANEANPLRLSLHSRDALPVATAHPLLAPGVCLQLPTHGNLEVDTTWLLRVAQLAPAQLPQDWRSRDRPWRAFCDAGKLAAPVLTTPQPGMQIAPLGMQGRRRALGDLFTDHKIPLALRARWPIVVDEAGRVVWVCGLMLADHVRVTGTTERVYSLTWQPKEHGIHQHSNDQHSSARFYSEHDISEHASSSQNDAGSRS